MPGPAFVTELHVRDARRLHPLALAASFRTGFAPKVSLHVPAYNEPPEVVGQTLRALAHLDYPNFEVLLIDNNTPDEATWRPLHTLCQQLGPRFNCVHLDRWPGYKSGALNFALAQTASDAEVIAIIDADYQVAPEFLRETLPFFADPQVAFLQTPQDFRDYAGNPFLEASYDAGRFFFEVAMPLRNERNAIIFGGTMGLICKSALQAVGGWDEWCITEDAELSLRLLKQGWQSVYLNRRYGRGLMPLDFEALKKQRFRWCFGGIQMLCKHWEALMPWARWSSRPRCCLRRKRRPQHPRSHHRWRTPQPQRRSSRSHHWVPPQPCHRAKVQSHRCRRPRRQNRRLGHPRPRPTFAQPRRRNSRPLHLRQPPRLRRQRPPDPSRLGCPPI